MSAVRKFFEAENGTIEISLGAPLDNDGDYYQFKSIMAFDLHQQAIIENRVDGNVA